MIEIAVPSLLLWGPSLACLSSRFRARVSLLCAALARAACARTMRRDASLWRPRSDTITSGGFRRGPLALLLRPRAPESLDDDVSLVGGMEACLSTVKRSAKDGHQPV